MSSPEPPYGGEGGPADDPTQAYPPAPGGAPASEYAQQPPPQKGKQARWLWPVVVLIAVLGIVAGIIASENKSGSTSTVVNEQTTSSLGINVQAPTRTETTTTTNTVTAPPKTVTAPAPPATNSTPTVTTQKAPTETSGAEKTTPTTPSP